jgi:predicted metalloprotease with PDZ domain
MTLPLQPQRFLKAVVLLTAAAAQLFALGTARPAPMERSPIVYTVRIPAPKTHYVDVEAIVPTDGQAAVELMMAVWTPGSYLIREYERHVESMRARTPDGRPLGVEKTRKNRWRVEAGGTPRVVVTYEVYCHELTVRSNFVEDGFAMLNGAPTFVTLAGGTDRPHDVRLVLPDGWSRSATALPAAPDGQPHHYVAPDFDTLVDAPILAGGLTVHPFEVDGTPHYLVNAGDDSRWDAPRAVADLKRIVEEWRRMWGQLPYPVYYFLNVVVESGGGIEHKNCTLMMSTRWQTRTTRAYQNWLGVASHEFLHAWNVKRLRPVALGPFDYENENYTRALWVAEGVTSYYGDLALLRAGLLGRREYLERLSERTAALETHPGRLVLPLEEASFDAWIREYRPDENTVNSAVSYYTKGAAVAFLLDARIRRASGGARSLDDAMRLAYRRYAGPHGFTDAEFRRTMEEVAGEPLDSWFDQVLRTTAELDYEEALQWFGLRFAPADAPRADGHEKAWLGLATRGEPGRLVVTAVPRGTPAYGTGVSVDDEIIAIDEYRVGPGEMEELLRQFLPGDRIVLTISRRGRLQRVEMTLGAEPAKRWTFQTDPAATDEQKAHFDAWAGTR